MNINKLIPKQIHVPYIGAIWELVGCVSFILSILNMLFVTIITYSTNDTVRHIFPSYWIFFIIYSIFGGIMALVSYVYILPSRIKFLQEQSVIDNRNPMYDKICENEKLLKEMKQLIEDKYVR